MIAKLTGRFDSAGEDWAIVDVGGVGYLLHCSAQTLAAIGMPGTSVSLHTELQVRDDRLDLFGFSSVAEREWFRQLRTVQGVGARMALSILSVLAPEALAAAIASQDKAPLTRASGVGPKLGQRIVSELRDRVAELGLAQATQVALAAAGPGDAPEDAISALVNLGYRRVDAHGAVVRALGSLGEGASIESLIKAGLKELAS